MLGTRRIETVPSVCVFVVFLKLLFRRFLSAFAKLHIAKRRSRPVQASILLWNHSEWRHNKAPTIRVVHGVDRHGSFLRGARVAKDRFVDAGLNSASERGRLSIVPSVTEREPPKGFRKHLD